MLQVLIPWIRFMLYFLWNNIIKFSHFNYTIFIQMFCCYWPDILLQKTQVSASRDCSFECASSICGCCQGYQWKPSSSGFHWLWLIVSYENNIRIWVQLPDLFKHLILEVFVWRVCSDHKNYCLKLSWKPWWWTTFWTNICMTCNTSSNS